MALVSTLVYSYWPAWKNAQGGRRILDCPRALHRAAAAVPFLFVSFVLLPSRKPASFPIAPFLQFGFHTQMLVHSLVECECLIDTDTNTPTRKGTLSSPPPQEDLTPRQSKGKVGQLRITPSSAWAVGAYKDPGDKEEEQHHVAEPPALSFGHLVHAFERAAQECRSIIECLAQHAQILGTFSHLGADVECDFLEHGHACGETIETLVVLLLEILRRSCGSVVRGGPAEDAVAMGFLFRRTDKVGAAVGGWRGRGAAREQRVPVRSACAPIHRGEMADWHRRCLRINSEQPSTPAALDSIQQAEPTHKERGRMTRTVGSPASLLAGLHLVSHVNLRCGRPTSAWLRDCAAMRRCPRWLDGSELSHCQMCVSVCALRVSLSLMDANEDGRGVQRRRIGLGRSVRRISRWTIAGRGCSGAAHSGVKSDIDEPRSAGGS
ncbi:hypothetical protein L1887_61071 [Cichorium endivia]|nr:hypothetical protein L1887_61071 [Cichorium endivia]